MGDGDKTPLRLQFNPKVRLEFHGATITSDAGLLPIRELDDALGLTHIAAEPESPSPSCLCWLVLMGDLDGIAGTDLVFAEVQRRQCELGSAVVWCSLGWRTEPPTLAGQRLGGSFILCFQRWLE